jgi:hypothetical protein
VNHSHRGPIGDDDVAFALDLIEKSGVANWLEDALAAAHRGPGRPRALSVRALLVALVLLARDDRALHLTGATDVLFCRLSPTARLSLNLTRAVTDEPSFLARYRQVRYLFHAVCAVLDPSGLAKNHRLSADELRSRSRVMSDDERSRARERLEQFSGALLAATVPAASAAVAYGLDATPVPLFSRGPSTRTGLCATDPDGGWYVREGDHRDREDHRGRKRSRVHWALEATVLTSSSATPGTVPDAPNLVVGLALERPGVGPAATALRVMAGAVSRGSPPGPLGVDRAYSAALPESFHLPARALGFTPVMDYRVNQLGRQANSQGAVMVEGTWCCPAMGEALVTATSDYRAGAIDADTYATRITARHDFALRRKSGPDPDGYERFMCPARGEHPSVRCELRPPSLVHLGRRTVESPPEEPPTLCRQHSITIAPDVGARFAQSPPFGTDEWARLYATLRNTIEGWNGFAKDTAHESLAQPARRRVRGLAAQGILVTFLYVAANLRKIETHHAQLAHREKVEAQKRTRRRRVSLRDFQPA